MDENWPNSGEPDKPLENTRTTPEQHQNNRDGPPRPWGDVSRRVVTIIYRLITGDGTQEIVFNLIPMESLTISITTSSEGMVVPESFFYVVGLFFCVLLLAISGGIAKVLIANGTKMHQPDIQGSLEKLRKEIQEQKHRRT